MTDEQIKERTETGVTGEFGGTQSAPLLLKKRMDEWKRRKLEEQRRRWYYEDKSGETEAAVERHRERKHNR
jgi:hypothetical protein